MTEHETNLRDLAAMFAMAALIARNSTGVEVTIPIAFELADQFMLARNPTPEDGIAALKPKRRKPNEQD
jgi:hypothetical protein